MSEDVVLVEDLEVRHSASFRLEVERLSIRGGESLACIGPSGSGKTTLLQVVAGLHVPHRGRVRTAGVDLGGLGDAERRRLRRTSIGFVFQEFELLDYLDALDNILAPFWIGSGPGAEDRDRARELAAELGLGSLLHRRPGRLSQGERQRIAIARALVTQPKLLLCDEPTGNLDPATTSETLELILGQAAGRGAAVMLVTHDHSLLGRFDASIDLGSTRRVRATSGGGEG